MFIFSSLLVSFIFVNIRPSLGDVCPDPVRCGRPSSIADLLCYLNQPKPGQSFAVLGWEDRVGVYCSYYLDCQPAKRNNFNILDIYGYIFNLSYPVKQGNKIVDVYKIWYVDLTTPGCPQVQEVKNLIYNFNGFNQAILHGPSPLDEVYFAYAALYLDSPTACNTFPTTSYGCSGGASYDRSSFYQYGNCPYPSPYNFKPPIATVDMSHIKNLAIVQSTVIGGNASVGQQFINSYGLYAKCDTKLQVEAISNAGQLAVGYCRENEYDDFPACNRIDSRNSVSEIVKSYGYDKYLNTFDQNKACTVSTLYAQGYNNQNGCRNDYSSCNCNSYKNFVGMSIILNGGTSPDVEAVVFIVMKGYADQRLKEDMLNKVLTIC